MTEELKEIIEFANQNPSTWIATCEGDQPRVRGFLMWFADESGFYFHTAKKKSIASQLEKNPKVEIGFIRNADKPTFEMLRVAGVSQEVNDKELEKRLYEERPWLWDNVKNSGIDSDVLIFRVVNGSAYVWSMANNIQEDKIPRVKF